MRKPFLWEQGLNEKHGQTLEGSDIVVKTICGREYSQTCAHGWIYEYYEGNKIEEEMKRPTPYNVKMEF